jgi:hypothetical protein
MTEKRESRTDRDLGATNRIFGFERSDGSHTETIKVKPVDARLDALFE